MAALTVTVTAIAACSGRGDSTDPAALPVAALTPSAAPDQDGDAVPGEGDGSDAPSDAEVAPEPSASEATPETSETAPPSSTLPAGTVPTTTVPAEPEPATEDAVVDDRPIERPDTPIEPVWEESGPTTARAQEFLLGLGFWLQDTTGEYGVSTSQAVMAFQKYYGLDTDGKLGPRTAEAMNAVTDRPTGRSTGGTLVEVDKSKQLVFLIVDGRTEWVLNTSTGSEEPYREPDRNTPGAFVEDDSITRPGVFKVNRERTEGWWEGDLGEIYRPKYFDGGIALHGAYNVPPYPASHGCVRLSIPAMDWIWENDIVPKGTTVWVHGEIPGSGEDDTA